MFFYEWIVLCGYVRGNYNDLWSVQGLCTFQFSIDLHDQINILYNQVNNFLLLLKNNFKQLK